MRILQEVVRPESAKAEVLQNAMPGQGIQGAAEEAQGGSMSGAKHTIESELSYAGEDWISVDAAQQIIEQLQAARDALQAEVNKKDAELIDVTHHRLALVKEVKEMKSERDALLKALKSPISHEEISRLFWRDEFGSIVTRPSFVEELIAERIEQAESH